VTAPKRSGSESPDLIDFGKRPSHRWRRITAPGRVREAAPWRAVGRGDRWRGLLVPELAEVLPFTGVALLSGIIWASWHDSITAVVYPDAGLPAWFWLLTFTFVAIAISFAQAWLRLKSGSLASTAKSTG
jgi:hypothetical protein